MKAIFLQIIFVLTSNFYLLHAQLENEVVYSEQIKTVRAYRQGWDLSNPILILGSNDHIIIDFDFISEESVDFDYEVIHCTKDWNISAIAEQDYINGFALNPVTDMQPSQNTLISYFHYTIILPNADLSFKISGNYLLRIRDRDGNIQFQRRFYVYQEKSILEVNVKRPAKADYADTHQDVEVKATLHGINATKDPKNELYMVVMQNFRTDCSRSGILPTYINGNSLQYKENDNLLFPGLTEFRQFNCKNPRLPMNRISEIAFKHPTYYFRLLKDEDWQFKDYVTDPDINGKYKIESYQQVLSDLRADYVYVTFTLSQDAPLLEGKLFINGSFVQWQLQKNVEMIYDFETHQYQRTIMLKQGYYNYMYSVLEKNTIDNIFMQGSHFESENEYQALLYYSNPSLRYDELVGYGRSK